MASFWTWASNHWFLTFVLAFVALICINSIVGKFLGIFRPRTIQHVYQVNGEEVRNLSQVSEAHLRGLAAAAGAARRQLQDSIAAQPAPRNVSRTRFERID